MAKCSAMSSSVAVATAFGCFGGLLSGAPERDGTVSVFAGLGAMMIGEGNQALKLCNIAQDHLGRRVGSTFGARNATRPCSATTLSPATVITPTEPR
jgi:hypothetical protein